MSTVIIHIAYANGQMRSRAVSKGEAFQILGRANSKSQKIPHAGDEQLVIFGAGGREYQVPSQITIVVPSSLPYHIPRPNRQGLFVRDNGQCGYCLRRLNLQDSTIDHIIPRSRGGKHIWENLILCCKKCNTKKGNKLPQEAGMKLQMRPSIPKF